VIKGKLVPTVCCVLKKINEIGGIWVLGTIKYFIFSGSKIVSKIKYKFIIVTKMVSLWY